MKLIFIFSLFVFPSFIVSNPAEETFTVQFENVPLAELVRYVSTVSETAFFFHEQELEAHVSMISGKPLTKESILTAFLEILRSHSFEVTEQKEYFLIRKRDSSNELSFAKINKEGRESFYLYKLEYHLGSELLTALKAAASSLGEDNSSLKKSLESIQWVSSTNSFMYTAPPEDQPLVEELIKQMDIPLKQVFIEVLVIETNVKKGLDFGIDWTLSSKSDRQESWAKLHYQPRHGTELGMFGDLIKHNGMNFLSISALVSALQQDKDIKIVLNQKIVAQDNKPSKIFVGGNVPFPGSTVETIGQLQQITANVDYRDVGVQLTIKPLIGRYGMITLEIAEEISSVVPKDGDEKQGTETTKTQMSTSVHALDKHFLLLSGMGRQNSVQRKSGIPLLRSLPWIGSLFSRNVTREEKRSMIMFVRPQIIDTNHFTHHPDLEECAIPTGI